MSWAKCTRAFYSWIIISDAALYSVTAQLICFCLHKLASRNMWVGIALQCWEANISCNGSYDLLIMVTLPLLSFSSWQPSDIFLSFEICDSCQQWYRVPVKPWSTIQPSPMPLPRAMCALYIAASWWKPTLLRAVWRILATGMISTVLHRLTITLFSLIIKCLLNWHLWYDFAVLFDTGTPSAHAGYGR